MCGKQVASHYHTSATLARLLIVGDGAARAAAAMRPEEKTVVNFMLIVECLRKEYVQKV